MNRRSAIKHVVGALGAAKLWDAGATAASQLPGGAHQIQTAKITAYVSKQGEIVGLVLMPEPGKLQSVRATGSTILAGCEAKKASSKRLPTGVFEFTKELVHAGDGQSCRLTERILPGKNGSVRWEIEILGDGAPWSTSIETHLTWPATAKTEFWTTWGDSRTEDAADWNDPLVPAKFGVRSLHYGAKDVMSSQGFSVPVATVLDGANDVGFSLALDPGDNVIEMDLNTTAAGEIVFARTNNRISKDRPVRFSLDLVAHAADWRGGLGWMVARYPEQFNPPNPLTYEIAGNAAYAEYEGNELDAYKFFSMGFRVNWKASFDFYTMGLFLPLVGDDVEYVCPRINEATEEFPTSIAHLRKYSDQMRRSGFYVLNYFNVGEFGHLIQNPPAPPRKAKNDADLWRDANDFAWYAIPDALMYGEDGKLSHGGQGDVIVDIGEPVYQRVLLDQVKRHIEKFPASSGLALDEMQFERRYNYRRDDGLTWVKGKPARSLVNSWKDWMNQMGPLMVKANKVIYSNPLYRRLDLMTHLDGFYDEFAFVPYSLNTNVFMALRKPLLAWTINIFDPDPDAYFQRHLHLGANVTVPYPMDNHEIMPSGNKIDRAFVDYGPLFDSLQGRTWVLHPHAIKVEGEKAKANLFAIPGGYLAMLTFGGDNNHAKVTLRGLERLPDQTKFSISAIKPGDAEWAPLTAAQNGNAITLNVPLHRGCAAVKLSYLWINPARHYFVQDEFVTLGTTLEDAEIRYTLDGREPTVKSQLYDDDSFLVDKTTTVRAAAFLNGSRTGPILSADFVKTLPPAPWIDPFQGTFKENIFVQLSHGYPIQGAEIRFTLDGGDVTLESPRYTTPIEISKTTTLRTRTFLPRLEPSVTVSHQYSKLPPPARTPDVYITDLTPIKSSFVSHLTMKKDRSLSDTPMSLAGQKFRRGIGTVSPSTLVYKLESNFESFVATVGIDDAVLNLPRKSPYTEMARFRVFARNDREEFLICETPMLVPGESWPIDVKIPIESREVRLVANGGMDWEYVNWSNAGFVLDHSNQWTELMKVLKQDAEK